MTRHLRPETSRATLLRSAGLQSRCMSAVRPSRKAGPIRMSLSSRFENIEMVQHLCTKLLEGRNVPEMRSAPESRVPDAGGMAVPRAREYGPMGGAPGRAPVGIERGGPSPSRPSGPAASPAPSRGGAGGSVAVPRSQSSGDGGAAPRRGGRGGQ